MRTACSLSLAFAGFGAIAPAQTFDPPVALMVGALPIDHDGAMMYPSPAMFDADGDGAVELVIGTVHGRMHLFENVASDDQAPRWRAAGLLADRDRQPLRVRTS